MNRRLARSLVISLGVASAVGLAASGCGGSSSSTLFFDDGDEGLAANSPAIVALAAGDLGLQAALAVMDPTNHQPVQSRPNISASGDATSGTLTLDFGSDESTGNEVAEVDLRDEIEVTYQRSGATGTVTIDFTTLAARTDHLGVVDVGGTLIYNVTFSGATASGSINFNVVVVSNVEVADVTGTLNYTLNNRLMTHTSGTLTHDSSLRGDWTSSWNDVEFTTDPPLSRVIDSGTISLTRTSGSTLGVSLLFQGPNSGRLTITPGGTQRSFDL